MSALEHWIVKNGRRIYRRLGGINSPWSADYGKPIATPQQGNDFIATKIREGTPFFAARLGSTELSCLANYIQIHEVQNSSKLSAVKKQITGYDASWNATVRHNISFYSGFFPPIDDMLDRFCRLYLDDLGTVDLLGVWYNIFEDYVCRHYCSRAELADLTSLEPYFHNNPWSAHLKDHTVIIVHPFAKSIQKQLAHRQKLFKDPAILPDFKAIPIKAVQTIADSDTSFENWFDALDAMCQQVARYDFDIALIGAGAYGLPLGAYVKRLGRQAIHMGGATQILFGIKGKRWDDHPIIPSFYNNYWTRPLEEEKPAKADNVEGGCYW